MEITQVIEATQAARATKMRNQENVYRLFLNSVFENVTENLASKIETASKLGRASTDIRRYNKRKEWILTFNENFEISEPSESCVQESISLDFLFNGQPDSRGEDGKAVVEENKGRNYFHQYGLKSVREMIEEAYPGFIVKRVVLPNDPYVVRMQLKWPMTKN